MKNATPIQDQYNLLTKLLERTRWQLEGQCEDIDCDKYIYKNYLKKKIHHSLEHSFSCIPGLKRDFAAIRKLLEEKKFKKLRYKKCIVCKKAMDTLDEKNTHTSFIAIHLSGKGKWKGYEAKIYQTHKPCKKKLETPDGFKKFL